MEARRLAILSSHICPIAPNSSPVRFSGVSVSDCSSSSNGDEQRLPDSNEGTPQNGCVFCRIIRGESPAFKLYEDDTCLCILDTSPLSYGHSLIIPKSHYSSLEATPPSIDIPRQSVTLAKEGALPVFHTYLADQKGLSVVAAMSSKVPVISRAIMKATGCDSFNLLVNNGAAAGQVIFHTHVHIIPRKARDCLWASESLRRCTLDVDREASQLTDRVREQLSNLCEDSKSQEQSFS